MPGLLTWFYWTTCIKLKTPCKQECLGFAPNADLHIYRVFTNNQVCFQLNWYIIILCSFMSTYHFNLRLSLHWISQKILLFPNQTFPIILSIGQFWYIWPIAYCSLKIYCSSGYVFHNVVGKRKHQILKLTIMKSKHVLVF